MGIPVHDRFSATSAPRPFGWRTIVIGALVALVIGIGCYLAGTILCEVGAQPIFKPGQDVGLPASERGRS